jgi:hypothetical protein
MRTSLRDGDHVEAKKASRNGPLLNGSGGVVSAQLDVAANDWVEARIIEL